MNLNYTVFLFVSLCNKDRREGLDEMIKMTRSVHGLLYL